MLTGDNEATARKFADSRYSEFMQIPAGDKLNIIKSKTGESLQ